MNRPKSTTRKSNPQSTSKNNLPHKKELSDTIYLMQNENEILKLKYTHAIIRRNQEISHKLDSLNT